MMRSFFGTQEGDFSVEITSVKAVSRPEDPEAGFTSEKSDYSAVEVSKLCCINGCIANVQQKKEPWSWKNSRLVGLALIFGTTWAFCTGVCWYKGLDISMMTPRNWWRMAKYDRLP